MLIPRAVPTRHGRDTRRARLGSRCPSTRGQTRPALHIRCTSRQARLPTLHARELPPMTERIPVLIVGAGPVGLALAGELGWRGVPCMLIEKTDGSIEQPKMDMVGPRTMEFCRRWGILDWVRDAPYPLDYPQDYIYVTGLNGYELSREPFPGRGFEPCPPESPQKRERVPQDMFDPILRRFAERSSQVSLRYNCELISFTEKADGVTARVRNTLTCAEE